MTSFTPADGAAPSTASIVLATAILAVGIGYFVGSAASVGIIGGSSRGSKSKKPHKSWPNSYDVTIHPDSSDEELMKSLGRKPGEGTRDDDSDDHDDDTSNEETTQETKAGLRSFVESREECKLVLVVRTDLGMGKGKIAAQACHATLACFSALQSVSAGQTLLKRWKALGQAKIAVQAQSEEELKVLQAQAISLGLCAKIIHDAGRTQIASGTATVLGVGPGPKSVVDRVTGGLKLL